MKLRANLVFYINILIDTYALPFDRQFMQTVKQFTKSAASFKDLATVKTKILALSFIVGEIFYSDNK